MPAAGTSYTLEDQERMASAANYFAWQHRLVIPELGRRVIEIGCGIGNFTLLMLDREAVLAVDVEPGCVERLRQRFPDRPNLRAVACDVMAREFGQFQSFSADSCVCLNVLEHIEHDGDALRRMASVLTPGGVLILLVPASPSLYGPIDELLGHYRRYTRASISKLAQEAGLSVKTAYYLNAIGFFGWWTNSHILKLHAQSPAQIGFFDRYVVPIASRVESIIHPPFGQSLFVVLKKTL
ncbi:MAG TPA: class I SAM-dependent methyltransferase [Bryobacteraceae bacterium]|jgi:ubiquinone/menaquinone biosynthesis C-methylase UbiE|nr:class I SAM-dependent methyltransferase [Bryobacteraceae bacterium]